MTKDSISIVLCGEAGQGIQTVEQLLTRILKLSGCNVFATKELMSRIRGGSNSTEIRVSSRPIRTFSRTVDLLIPLDKHAVSHMEKRVTEDTVIIADGTKVGQIEDMIDVPFDGIAKELGGPIYANVIAVGIICGIIGIDKRIADKYIEKKFRKKGDDVLKNNIAAFDKGLDAARSFKDRFSIDIVKSPAVVDHMLINGAEAVSMGAAAGGCNFISSYPMSPSTGVLVFLSQNAERFGIVAEQAEDEICAINMSLGAWYAGARALVTTSGGGFALMGEGLSLSGILETPTVVHIAQRPGPGTGLPTRTEQGDLDLALYSGHGDFPRAILAPGDLEEGFLLSRHAFHLADRFQSPVLILTDQFFVDSYYNMMELDVPEALKNEIVETAEDYKRYTLTPDGISPRGVPSNGSGLVQVDSDEHDETGHITEDEDMRNSMVSKRKAKLESLKAESLPPVLKGSVECKRLVVCWGSTKNALIEAVVSLDWKDTAILHIPQVYPLHDDVRNIIARAERVAFVENNATGQLAGLIRRTFNLKTETLILKSSGMPFSVEELVERLKETIG